MTETLRGAECRLQQPLPPALPATQGRLEEHYGPHELGPVHFLVNPEGLG